MCVCVEGVNAQCPFVSGEGQRALVCVCVCWGGGVNAPHPLCLVRGRGRCGACSHPSSSASQNIPVSILCKTSEVWRPCFGNRPKHSKRAKDWLRFMPVV